MKTSSSIAALSNRVAQRAPWAVREANKHALEQLEPIIRKEVGKWLKGLSRRKIKSMELRPWDGGNGGQWRIHVKESLFSAFTEPPQAGFYSKPLIRAAAGLGYKLQGRGGDKIYSGVLYIAFEINPAAREDFLDSLDPAEAAALRELDEMGVW